MSTEERDLRQFTLDERLERDSELVTVLGQYSSLFIKRHLVDMSEQEVAESEGLKRGTASGYLSRARHLLSQERARFTSFL